jgi:hypothetical protein
MPYFLAKVGRFLVLVLKLAVDGSYLVVMFWYGFFEQGMLGTATARVPSLSGFA